MKLSTRTVQARHGTFTYFTDDTVVGCALRIYGEYSEDEVSLYRVLLRRDDIVIEVGANIGSLTVPLSRCCKSIYAFEPQPENFDLLVSNLNCNGIANVTAFPFAIGADIGQINIPALDTIYHNNFGNVEAGSGELEVEIKSLDKMRSLEKLKIKFIKIDVEGMELEVLKGAEQIINRDSPILYVENDRKEKSEALVNWLHDHDYRCFWHLPRLYHPENFRRYNDSIFGNSTSTNMLCYRGNQNTNGVDQLGSEVA